MSSQGVKDEIDAQSGRFEFLKQALTLGLAGLAGTAAIFTDTAKIPQDAGVVLAVGAIGLFLLALVGASLMGLSTYANLLKAHSEDAAVDGFRTSIIAHARWVFGLIGLIAVAFVTYAVLQVLRRDEKHVTATEAIGLSRTAMAATGCEAQFESIQRSAGVFRVIFRSDFCKRRFMVQVKAADGVVAIGPVA